MPYPCSYKENRESQNLAAVLSSLPEDIAFVLTENGFRHSGEFWYRPVCEGCEQCVPLRIEAASFKPTKSQRRVWRKNADVEFYMAELLYNEEKQRIYTEYLKYQHPESHQTGEELRDFLYAKHRFGREVRYLINGRLVAISIVDYFAKGALSSVYHFFDPEFAHRSLGVFSILSEIELCKSLELPYYYLGYWVPGCAKMQYKADYGPNELLYQGAWMAKESVLNRGLDIGVDDG